MEEPGMSQPTNNITSYVVGFAFDGLKTVMIRKKRPAWQYDSLNGVGGKMEPGETPTKAMEREFWEETGYSISHFDWKHYSTESWPEAKVHYLFAFLPHNGSELCRTTTDEPIEIVNFLQLDDYHFVDNVRMQLELYKMIGNSPGWKPVEMRYERV
jgi:8-oxo-dGTP pyrophosphatase MutT (NUDIX family)